MRSAFSHPPHDCISPFFVGVYPYRGECLNASMCSGPQGFPVVTPLRIRFYFTPHNECQFQLRCERGVASQPVGVLCSVLGLCVCLSTMYRSLEFGGRFFQSSILFFRGDGCQVGGGVNTFGGWCFLSTPSASPSGFCVALWVYVSVSQPFTDPGTGRKYF